LDIDTQPWPLQLFWPLQLLLADLHSEVPLHEFTPLQCTVASSAALAAVVMTVVNNMAAAAAIAALDILLICMLESSLSACAAILLLTTIDPSNRAIITRKQELVPVSQYLGGCIRRRSMAELE
jgi:hypothetical protein